MKHEYTFEELAELKKIYDESGEAGLELGEMRALRKAGLLTPDLPPEQEAHEDILADYQAVGKHSPRKITTSGKKKETIVTVASKPVASKEEPMSQGITANKETAPAKRCENPRAIISNALTGIFDAISALQRTAFQTNDKVVYGFATKLLNGELMDLKANYSKDVAK